MGTTAIVSAILTLLAGIGIFLVACQMMISNLESASSTKLKSLFAKGICNANAGAQYLELSSNTERIADHLINVAKTIRSLQTA